jgi:hypothetical protein
MTTLFTTNKKHMFTKKNSLKDLLQRANKKPTKVKHSTHREENENNIVHEN